MAKKNYTKTVFTILAYLFVMGVPIAIGFGWMLPEFLENLWDNTPEIITVGMMWVSIIMCGYCIIRTFLGIVCNVFLPKIPTPKNMALKIIVLGIIGVLIGIFSPAWVLILWVVTCLIGMSTYSFV